MPTVWHRLRLAEVARGDVVVHDGLRGVRFVNEGRVASLLCRTLASKTIRTASNGWQRGGYRVLYC